MKRVFSWLSSLALILIIITLLVPSWRIPFQGWVQGLFAAEHTFAQEQEDPLSTEVLNWQLTPVNDMPVSSFSNYLGKPILLSFWATWCPPCRTELSELAELNEMLGDDAHIISVSEESTETIEKSGLDKSYDFLYSTDRFPSFFNVTSYPTLVIISPEGKRIQTATGAADLASEKNAEFIRELVQKR